MARINVSVPDSLRERMSALDDKVNWSEVAQTAFERELSTRNLEISDMEQVIERLRASKVDYEKSENDRGRKAGREWACRFAQYHELKTISDLELEGTDYAQQIDVALGKNSRNGDSFWMDKEAGRIKYPTDQFVWGFWDAADDVFAEVHDKI
jgi:hypothetical protein